MSALQKKQKQDIHAKSADGLLLIVTNGDGDQLFNDVRSHIHQVFVFSHRERVVHFHNANGGQGLRGVSAQKAKVLSIRPS